MSGEDGPGVSNAEAVPHAQSIVDTIRESLVVLDLDLRVDSVNRAFTRTFGLSAKDAVGRRLEDLGRGDWNSAALVARLRGLAEGDAMEGFRVEAELPDVGRRVFLLNARRIQGARALLLALEDMTERDAAERAVAASESSLRELLSTAAEAILMVDGAGKIVFANDAVMRLYGYEERELRGASLDALIPERQRAEHAARRHAFVAAPSAGAMTRPRTALGRRKDGSEFPAEVVLSTLKRNGADLTVAFISDESARRESERQLAEYQDKLRQMAFDAALAEERTRRKIAVDLHDRIGQSLALAQITLTGCRPELEGAPRTAVDEAIALVSQSIEDARTLIFELSPPVLYDLGLKAALGWLVDDMEARHGVRFDLVDDGLEKPLDVSTAALVFRAVRELMMNVRKHAQTQSAKVALRRVGDAIEVDVEDHGVGFDPAAGTERGGGGFGLFSVREQIGRLGGGLEIHSARGEGTRVCLHVPLGPPPPARSEEGGAP